MVTTPPLTTTEPPPEIQEDHKLASRELPLKSSNPLKVAAPFDDNVAAGFP